MIITHVCIRAHCTVPTLPLPTPPDVGDPRAWPPSPLQTWDPHQPQPPLLVASGGHHWKPV